MRRSISLFVVGLTACAGKAPPNPGSTTDAGGGGTDAPPAATSAMLSGTVMDYFGGQPAAAMTVDTDGIDPPVQATSGTDGAYQLQIAVGSKLFLVASGTNYRPTRSSAVSVGDMPVTQNIYAMTEQDVKNQYVSAGGLTPTAGTAFLVAELEKNNGDALDGIPLTNVQLLDANQQPVTGIIGPYFFGCEGAIDPALTTAPTCTPARDRAAFLDVPPGSYTLAVTYTSGMGGNTQNNTSVTTMADGATLALSGGMSAGAGGMGSGSGSGSAMGNPTDPTFATDIYPRLQRAAQGGLGCANCHTANGPAAVLPYDDAPATVLANMQAAAVLDLTTPTNSLFLVKPLYEQPPAVQDHPNATFLDTNDPDYKLFLLWITNGAKP